jgi:superfamily I DNA/RNA helicase
MMPHPLNHAQKQAVEHQMGPLLVLAGAGSGKTRVITQRIARLLERGVPAHAIVALTFTNKAAGEMRERVAHVLGPRGKSNAKQLTISTFHSFGLQVLTKERAAFGGVFTIFDQGDVLGTVKEVLRGLRADKSYDAAAILSRISNAKNAFLKAEDLPDSDIDEYDQITKLVYPKYQAALKHFRAYDFDDLVCEVARVFMERADVLTRWQERFAFVLVDEYQDTNRAQLEVLRLLAGRHRNICVVGDDDQSIYAWRGADVRNILDFDVHFPGATVIKLEQNYRSSAPILAVANEVISKRIDLKYKKTLFTEQAGGEKVHVRVAPSPEVEAAFVAREMKRQIRDLGRRPKDMAVLYRSNGQSKVIEEALRENSILHRVLGGQTFFERKEVKDILSYLKAAMNPNDEISLRRILNYPARGIGDTSVDKLALHALAKGWTLSQAVERVDALDDIPSAAREGCRALEKILQDTRRSLIVEKALPSDVVRQVAAAAGIRQDIDSGSGSPNIAARRWGNIEALFRTFSKRDERRATADGSQKEDLANFLHALTLDFGADEEELKDAATLSTLHGSKGLEFEIVFLVGCEEGLLPHTRTIDAKVTDPNNQDIEEERRLFYVGVTRARRELFLSRSKHRVSRGKPMPRTPSRFLVEIPFEMVDEQEVTNVGVMDPQSVQAQADALLAALDALG